ncbi:MAG: hypothetical protein ACREPA_07925 [Candidatus Dormibacteraceae bacterium]
MSPGARDHELWADLLRRIGGLVRDVVPPEAEVHLLNAQRELLTAVVIMYEHQAGTRRGVPPRTPRRRAPARRRPTRIEVD